jgi:drug/metabolite transporter (DMT)-like permease
MGTIVTGGIIAPVIQFTSLTITSAATASLLLNFEIIATAGFAWSVFHERVSRTVLLAIVMVLTGSLVLSFDMGSFCSFSLGAAGIVCSCIFWGLDNNLMGKVPLKDPGTLVILKGLAGGSILLMMMIVLHIPAPGPEIILATMLTGFFTFGLGLMLLITAIRSLGAARTGAYFATAPFIGALSSLVIFHEMPGLQLLISLPLFAAGIILLIFGQEIRLDRMVQRPVRNDMRNQPVFVIRMLFLQVSRNVLSKINNS